MVIEGVSYDVNWKAFKRGTSIFIPCLDGAEVKRMMGGYFKRAKLEVVMKVTIEEGVQGLRIWRL